MASAIELKSPSGAESVRIEHTSEVSKTLDANNIIQLGDHGIGTGALGIIGNDYNLSSTQCSFIKNDNAYAALNYPPLPGTSNLSPFVGININHSASWGLQIVGKVNDTTTPRLAHRVKENGVFSPWSEIYSQLNIKGGVSQSSGVPTGALIERGNNANGEYVRFADGTQMCFSASTISVGATTATQIQFTLPVTFSGTAYPLASVNEVYDGAAIPFIETRSVVLNPTNDAVRVGLYNGYGSTISITARLVVIGKWF